jgi:hypothetical protein
MPLTNEDDRHSLETYSAKDVARLARRAECTIRVLARKHGLPYRASWETYRRRRRRVMMFRKDVARWLIDITLRGCSPVDPPR